jgi:hypothetical protein
MGSATKIERFVPGLRKRSVRQAVKSQLFDALASLRQERS